MEGGCTCWHVRYRLEGRPMIVNACHCRWCQRETGTVHALNAVYEADRVVHTAAEPEIIETASASGKGQRIARCPTCKIASLAYLRHLHMSNEMTGAVLTTLHNLYFYLDLVGRARESIVAGRFETFRQKTLAGFSA